MRDIPGAKEPTAQGHGKRLVSTQVETETGVVNVLVCTGRIHLYEGHAPYEVCHIPQVAAMTGVKTAFLTNAGGCLRPWELGDLMTIRDQVNLSGVSPFTGPVFVDVKRVWNPVLSGVLERHTQRSGVYAILRGPEFQTDAESLMLRNNGVDMVGMSTVLEAIALHQLGVNVCGVSVTSDLSFSQAPTAHCEVLRMVQASLPRVRECFSAVAGASSARRF